VQRWVIGADGRTSTVARVLGLPKTNQRRGEMAMMYAFWRGLPETKFMHLHAESDGVLARGPQYDWSFWFARLPRPESTGPIFARLAKDRAAQEFRDVFSHRVDPRTASFARQRGKESSAA
jgi:2-polyprenyl-6-methoxyphenol hydroxylase-like FAD-dependent oxidoreductase